MGNLEDEIKQQRFTDDKHKAMINIMYTSNWIRDNHTHLFKEFGILQQHYNVLRIIRGRKGKPVTPGEIINVMIDKGRDLTRLVDKLVKLGYVERNKSTVNRRKINISITEAGMEITSVIEAKINDWVRDHIQMTPEESSVLNALLDKVRGSF